MAGRLGKRVIHFANLPIKMLIPSSFTDITEIALKTIPSASKIEIKRVLESSYGFQCCESGNPKHGRQEEEEGGLVLSKPDYKKAYVTLKSPLSISPDLFPIRMIQEEKMAVNKRSKTKHCGRGREEEDPSAPLRRPRSLQFREESSSPRFEA
ncbi:hypothetical protein Dimus_035575 [Dionaea muscipula]